jgi:hypothetical protein
MGEGTAVRTWPKVLDEFETMKRVVGGVSLSRFGDGELKLMRGSSQVREPANEELAAELRHILKHPPPNLLPAIPTMHKDGPKLDGWVRHMTSFAEYVDMGRVYGSAFVSRPDSSPWILCKEYLTLVQQLWAGKDVHVVCEKGNSLLALISMTAASVTHVVCPSHQSYKVADNLIKQVQGASLVVLSCGPAATCIAARLAAAGIHAVDLGSAGGFLLKLASMDNGPAVRVVLRRPADVTMEEMHEFLSKHYNVLYFDGKLRV